MKRHLMLPTGQAAPTCLTACIYPASKPGFVRCNWKVIVLSFLDHISVYAKLALPPQWSPQGSIARQRMKMLAVLLEIKETNT